MIADTQAFVMKLRDHAREKVLMPTFMPPPMTRYAPFWRWVHGEDRVELPGAAEFIQVLWEMGIYPNLKMFAPSEGDAGIVGGEAAWLYDTGRGAWALGFDFRATVVRRLPIAWRTTSSHSS
jgi:hypothetical protein